MLKQSLIYLILSILIIIFAKYAHLIMVYISLAYTFINIKLALLFNSTSLGVKMSQLFTLVALPLLLAAIPALLYRGIRGQTMPYFVEITWIFWIILVLSKVLV